MSTLRLKIYKIFIFPRILASLYRRDSLCSLAEEVDTLLLQPNLWDNSSKTAIADLKKTCTAVILDEAEEALWVFGDVWRKQSPSCFRSWKENEDVLKIFFEYPPGIRKNH